MDDIVAIRVSLGEAGSAYFLTWGRTFDAVDAGPLEELVLAHARTTCDFSDAIEARLCDTLHDAANEPYFYECFFDMCGRRAGADCDWHAWREARRIEQERHREIWLLGRPGEAG